MAKKKQVYKETVVGEMTEVLLKTIRHFFGSSEKLLRDVRDPRSPKMIKYPFASLFWTAVLLFLTKLGARRQINYEFQTKSFACNLDLLAGSRVGEVCHDGTLNHLFKRLDPEETIKIRTRMMRQLLRKKCLAWGRLFGLYHLVAIDGTGHLTFKKRHCAHCLTQEVNGKVIYYYHRVLDAKLILPNGMALSLATQFIENPEEGVDKQDCELKAFYRLSAALKRDFPQLRICLTMDGLYAAKPVFDICRNYRWRFIITFKEGSMPDTYGEYKKLKMLCPENTAERLREGVRQQYAWVTDIDYQSHCLSVLECVETKPREEQKKFVWLTNFEVSGDNYLIIGKGGRLRWKIENEGYNTQKNGGYNLEHIYSIDERAIKNFYLLLQIAHLINQLIEKGSLLKRDIRLFFGSIRNIARRLLESLRTFAVNAEEMEKKLSLPFQIRFDTS